MVSWFFLCVLLSFAHAKTVGGELHDKLAAHVPGWWYIDKFGYDVGVGNVTMMFEVAEDEAHAFVEGAEVALYLDEDWPRVLAAQTCEEKRALSKDRVQMTNFVQTLNTVNWGRSTVYRRRGVASTTRRSTLTHSRSITQYVRPHYWYFAWIHCEREAHYAQSSRDKIYFKFIFQQANGSHTPIDNKGVLQFFALMLAVYICGSMFYFRRYTEYRKKHKYEKIPDTVYVIPMALGCQITSVLFELFHLLLYARNGQGLMILDAFSEICTVISQVIVIRLLITYSRQEDILEDSVGWISSAVLTILTVALAVWSSSYDSADAHDVYHDHHTLPRLLLYVLHGVFAVWFLMDVSAQVKANSARFDRAEFWQLLRIAGITWFVSPPVFILLGYAFAEYWQNSVITVLVLASQCTALGCISHLSLTETPLHMEANRKTN